LRQAPFGFLAFPKGVLFCKIREQGKKENGGGWKNLTNIWNGGIIQVKEGKRG